MNEPVLLVRLRAGVVGESRRVVHVVPAPQHAAALPAVLTALCGERIMPGTAEVLPELGGMPCGPCFLAATPSPNERHDTHDRAGPGRRPLGCGGYLP